MVWSFSTRTADPCRACRRAGAGPFQPGHPADPVGELLPLPRPGRKARKADLRLDLKETALRKTEPVIVPGKSGESELFQRVTSNDPDE